MGRQQRRDFEGGWHHVMNRGAARRQVFFTRSDGASFERLLAEGVVISGARVHAYCLMSNHYHLLVELPDGGLSAFMQRLSSNYTKCLNHRLGADGPIFRARFHSIVVDSWKYVDRVGRYIHRNPTDVTPSSPLDQYRWSSYGSYVGRANVPTWLTTNVLAGMHDGITGFRDFVEGSIAPSTRPDTWELQWAIETSLHEMVEPDRQDNQALDTTVAILMLDRGSAALGEALQPLIAFPSAERVGCRCCVPDSGLSFDLNSSMSFTERSSWRPDPHGLCQTQPVRRIGRSVHAKRTGCV